MEKVLIIEDEALAVEKLQMLIHRIAPKMNVVAVLASVTESVQWLSNQSVDLIFLDINLADGISFRIFEQLEVETPIIFVTAYDQYAIKAFKQNSLDYLLKPIVEEELKRAITKFTKQKTKVLGYEQQLQQLLSQYLPQSNSYKNRILVTYGGKGKSIEVTDIAFIYAYEKGVFLTSFTNHTYLTDDTLDGLEQSLDSQLFFRANRKILVSIKAITEIYKYSTRRLKVELKPKPKFDVIVPAEKITTFKKWLNN